ncbi:IQ domain-containing protein IQM6, partial [Bienertia sinuspersici]
WQVLDLAELKHSSISFFDIEKHESAISRWSRARTRAAKVSIQHFQIIYLDQLDIGEGKDVNLERCPRCRLLQQCIKYLDPAEREEYEVIVENGKLIYKASQKTVDTLKGPKSTKWIFVLSTTRNLYVGQKIKGKFQHSSFLAGGATLSAGRLIVEDGILLAVWPHSGHYLPTEENFQAFMSFLKENKVDLTCIENSPLDDEDGTGAKTPAFRMSNLGANEQNSSAQDDENQARPQVSKLSEVANSSILLKRSHIIRSKIAKLRIPSMNDVADEEFKTPQLPPEQSPDSEDYGRVSSEDGDGFETAEDSFLSEDDFMRPKINLFEVYERPVFEEQISQATILKRIHSHKRTRSYQLGEHLQLKWTTGAGPRIGCVRDYPSRLQFQVLEQVNLSPRSRYNNSAVLGSDLHKLTTANKSTLGPSSVQISEIEE